MVRMEGKILLAGLVIEGVIVLLGLTQVAQGARLPGAGQFVGERVVPVVVASNETP